MSKTEIMYLKNSKKEKEKETSKQTLLELQNPKIEIFLIKINFELIFFSNSFIHKDLDIRIKLGNSKILRVFNVKLKDKEFFSILIQSTTNAFVLFPYYIYLTWSYSNMAQLQMHTSESSVDCLNSKYHWT